ncbi:hypothetical protein AC792_03845 [Arthrobacter sp. RIT-PI-e]|uniref:glycoside hydrolase family 26 protein n=1 Tax=Arthrobacter sp. RIT-PI-e TaxID=1681197 RepID=UPI0006769DD4|nr:glycosyl hydrolase [Arthrobacter sp. RIT-PI-e]KNC19801.1 hypothetical protein AC792_03845 [Arthrobacter sp. RIT-PI-e]
MRLRAEQQPTRDDGGITRRYVLGSALVGVIGAGLLRRDTPEEIGTDLVTRCRFGAYAANEPYPIDPHFALEERLGGTPLPVASWFQAWGSSWLEAEAAALAERGEYDVLLCWEPFGIDFDSILRGDHDEYIRTYVAAAARYPHLVVLRPFHESNGNWYDWAPGSGRGYVRDAEQWKDAWRHVVRLARTVPDSDSVSFYWCMNGGDVGGPSMEELWPGAEWVDIVGVDSYAWNGSAGGSFDQIHRDPYRRITALHPTAEYWVGETGLDSQENAAEWYRRTYRSQQFPRMTTVCWFHTAQFVLDGDQDALEVHRTELPRAPQYAGRIHPRSDHHQEEMGVQ